MNRSRKDPVQAGTQIEETLARMGVPRVATNLFIRRHWGELVSGQWRDKARPLVLQDSCLVVEVASQMDATVLRYGTASLLEELNTALGSRVVLRVAIKVSRSSYGQ